MTEFWENSFLNKQEMWGFLPSKSAELARNFFLEKGLKTTLIPGIGYGRNAKAFCDVGISVTGIEISKTAIDLARKHYGSAMIIYHGSVNEMPFDQQQYEGIFAYALLHLLEARERSKFIFRCYNQLADGGYMVFAVVTKEASIYGQGKHVGADQFEVFEGVNMFFYDRKSIEKAFSDVGLVDIIEVEDIYPFYLITCKKAAVSGVL